jgi:hypothetical protein
MNPRSSLCNLFLHFGAVPAFQNGQRCGWRRAVCGWVWQVKRTKEVLSANSEAPISVEELHDGIDFRSRITRCLLLP